MLCFLIDRRVLRPRETPCFSKQPAECGAVGSGRPLSHGRGGACAFEAASQDFGTLAHAPHRLSAYGNRSAASYAVMTVGIRGTPPGTRSHRKIAGVACRGTTSPTAKAGPRPDPPRKLVNKARCRRKSTRLIDEPSGNGRSRLVARPSRAATPLPRSASDCSSPRSCNDDRLSVCQLASRMRRLLRAWPQYAME